MNEENHEEIHEELIQKAYIRLYPEKQFLYNTEIKFSAKFSPYNANVKIRKNHLEFNLSKEWKQINEEITLGLIQSLLLKILHDKKTTTNIDLYNLFIKKLHMSIPKTKTEPELEESCSRVNEKYLYGLVEKPNLEWGTESTTKLGSYNYQTDTITISTIFQNAEISLLDYVMYHELLHKKHKFITKNNRSMHHTTHFKQKEAEYENFQETENQIKRLIITHKRKKFINKIRRPRIFGF